MTDKTSPVPLPTAAAARPGLFGPDRIRPGYEDQEWAVWVSGMDEIHDADTLTAALVHAAEFNAGVASDRVVSTSEYDPVVYAVVLRHGYAWAPSSLHRQGRDCGDPQCPTCAATREFPRSTPGGATVTLQQGADSTLTSHCTACGEYAWPQLPTREGAVEHARTCTRPARPRSAAA